MLEHGHPDGDAVGPGSERATGESEPTLKAGERPARPAAEARPALPFLNVPLVGNGCAMPDGRSAPRPQPVLV